MDTCFFAWPEPAEHENGLAHSRFAKLHAFASGSDTEPVGTEFLEGLGDFRAAVPVAIAFDDRENLSRRLALLGSGVYVAANGVEVVTKRAERNFSPDRTAHKVDRVAAAAGHAIPCGVTWRSKFFERIGFVLSNNRSPHFDSIASEPY